MKVIAYAVTADSPNPYRIFSRCHTALVVEALDFYSPLWYHARPGGKIPTPC